MARLKSNEQRAHNAILLIWFVLGLEIVSLISGILQYDLLQTVASSGEITNEAADANDFREQIIAIVYLIVFLVSAITFIQWFRRAYYNLHLKVNNLLYAESWAAGSWFVPVLNLFRPYQIMKELYEETKIILIQKESTIGENFSSDSLGWWWTLWIINSFLGQFILRYDAVEINELITLTIANIVSGIIGIPLALLAIKVIKNYSSIEPLLLDLKDE